MKSTERTDGFDEFRLAVTRVRASVAGKGSCSLTRTLVAAGLICPLGHTDAVLCKKSSCM